MVANYDLGSFSDDLKVLINSLFTEVCSILENKSMSKDRHDFFTRRIEMLSIDFSFKMKRELSGEGDLVGSVDDSIKIGSALWTIKKDLLPMK